MSQCGGHQVQGWAGSVQMGLVMLGPHSPSWAASEISVGSHQKAGGDDPSALHRRFRRLRRQRKTAAKSSDSEPHCRVETHLPSGCATAGKLLNLSVPRFPHKLNKGSCPTLWGYWEGPVCHHVRFLEYQEAQGTGVLMSKSFLSFPSYLDLICGLSP